MAITVLLHIMPSYIMDDILDQSSCNLAVSSPLKFLAVNWPQPMLSWD